MVGDKMMGFFCSQLKNRYVQSMIIGGSHPSKKNKPKWWVSLPQVIGFFKASLQDGPLPVINGVITPINGLIIR